WRQRHHELVVLAGGGGEGSGTPAERTSAGGRDRKARELDLDRHAARPAEVARILEDTVAHVDHRVRDAGELARRAQALRGKRQTPPAPGGRPPNREPCATDGPGNVQEIPRACPRPGHHPPLRLAEQADRDGESPPARQVAAHQARPRAPGRGRKARDERVQVGHPHRRRCFERQQGRRWHAAHGCHGTRIHRERAPAEGRRGAPTIPEGDPPRERVSGEEEQTTATTNDGCIIPGTDQDPAVVRPSLEVPHDMLDPSVLSEIAETKHVRTTTRDPVSGHRWTTRTSREVRTPSPASLPRRLHPPRHGLRTIHRKPRARSASDPRRSPGWAITPASL